MFDRFFQTLLFLTFSGSMACVLLLLGKKVILKYCGGRKSYYIWLIPLLLFLIPLKLDMALMVRRMEAFTAAPPANEIQLTTDGQQAASPAAGQALAEQTPQKTSEKMPSTKLPDDNSAYLFGIWTAGALLLLFRYLGAYHRYQYQLTHLGCLPVSDTAKDILEKTKEEMGIHRSVILISSIHTDSPLMTGFFQPKIILPCQELMEQEMALIFRHELTHYKHGDIWYKFFAAIVNAVQWFNPLSYLMVRNINESCEYACDESVTRSMDAGQRGLYSEMILKMLSFHALAPAFVSHLSKNKNILKRRFSFIMETKKHRKLIAGITACLLLCTSVLLPSAALGEEEKEFGVSTYYHAYKSLEWNINSTLQLPVSNEEGVAMSVRENGIYIDKDGFATVYHNYENRNTPVLCVTSKWAAKESAKPEGAVIKQYTVEENELTVLFVREAAGYANHPVVEKMIQNRFSYELHYKNPLGETKPEWNYDHPAFIRELMRRGVYIITAVQEPTEFQPMFRAPTADGGTLSYEVLSEGNKIDVAYRFWEEKVSLNQNIDGNQGKQFAESFVIPAGKTLAFNIEETSESMPTMNVAIIDLSTGKTVDWIPSMAVGMRLSYTPSENAGHIFKIMFSTDEPYGGEAKLSAYLY